MVYAPHEKLALLLSRYGDWTQQPELAEDRAQDLVIAAMNDIPSEGVPVQASRAQARKNYELLSRLTARLCDANIARNVDLFVPEKIGRLVELFVPRAVA